FRSVYFLLPPAHRGTRVIGTDALRSACEPLRHSSVLVSRPFAAASIEAEVGGSQRRIVGQSVNRAEAPSAIGGSIAGRDRFRDRVREFFTCSIAVCDNGGGGASEAVVASATPSESRPRSAGRG